MFCWKIVEIGVSKTPWGRGAPAPRIADYSTIQKGAAGAMPTPGKSHPRENELSSRFNVK